jgi:hypothetical protein
MDDLRDISGSLAARIADLTRLAVPDIPPPSPNPLVVAAESNYASAFHKRLAQWISNFDTELDEAHEVGVRLVNFGQSVTFRLSGIGYWNPSLISFQGVTEDGNPVELIQHVSQISVLLMKLPRTDPSIPKRPIGFEIE